MEGDASHLEDVAKGLLVHVQVAEVSRRGRRSERCGVVRGGRLLRNIKLHEKSIYINKIVRLYLSLSPMAGQTAGPRKLNSCMGPPF